MNLSKVIARWLEANREFARREMLSRAVVNQTKWKISELYDVTHNQASPGFVLSTGRCGTKLLTKILQAHPKIIALHEPFPEPYYYSGYAYRYADERPEELKVMIDCARYERIRDAFLAGRNYVETNNRITFFAHQLAGLFPKSRFVHLVRKPLAFVRSGQARGWYSDRVITDEGRIQPRDDVEVDWNSLSQIGKIAWLWNETNRFIEDFKTSVQAERILTVRSEDLFREPAVSGSIFEFLGVENLPEGTLRRLLGKPVNRQKPSTIRQLSEEEADEIRALTPLSEVYYG